MNHRARNTDPDTSHAAAHDVRYRAGTQKAQLLEVYRAIHPGSLTDEEAADLAGLNEGASQGWWKRCAELRHDGAIERTTTREGLFGSKVMACRWVDPTTPEFAEDVA